MIARWCALLVVTCFTANLFAQAAGETGLLVPVPVPLKSGDVKRIIERVNKARDAGANRPSKVVFDFNPGGNAATSSDYGDCYTLAKAISEWKDVSTIAFVSRPTTGHLVLPVLCCNELVMAPTAKLGEVIDPKGAALAPDELSAYQNRIGTQRPGQYAIVRKMFDRNVKLGKGEKDKGAFFLDLNEKDQLVKQGVLVSDTKPILEMGVLGLFTTAQLEEFGLVKVKADSTAELARLYGINPSTFRDDPLAGRTPVAFRYTLSDAITPSTTESLLRTVKKAVLNDKANLLILVLNCDEGDMTAAAQLAQGLLELQTASEEAGLRVVAYIPNSAKNTSVAIALGCSEIIMSKRKDQGDSVPPGTFGEFEGYLKSSGQTPDSISKLLAEIADKQNFPVLLVRGMVERELTIKLARNKTNRTLTRLMTNDEVSSSMGEWIAEREIKNAGSLLVLSATEAMNLGLVSRVIERSDIALVYEALALDPTKVKEATPGWIDQFRYFLQNPAVTVILVVIGFIGLILELKVPGTTVPGIVAAMCFLLVFWAWWANNQAVAALAGLLFLLGLILILIEVFVLPGFGMPGIVGILLMLTALTLITIDKLPEQGSDWMKLGGKMATYLFALMGSTVGAFTIARYLPKMPGANRMMLAPESEREAKAPTIMPGVAQAASLLGAIGVATTVLRPAGTVQFGEQFVDVVSDGGFIVPGTRVQVVEVEGTRIMVKEV
jgi:membrane-bound serine protease (ClpP class)